MKYFKEITSRENSLIKLACALQGSAKSRKENGLFVIEGLRFAKDCLENSIKFDKLIISHSAFDKYPEDIELFSENSNECYKIPDNLFKKISDTASPQGIMALAQFSQLNPPKIDKTGRYIALENLADPSNLGAVARTAEALGVSGIIISADSCDPYSPKALRASMGTLLRVPIIILKDFAAELMATGLKTYACVVDSSADSLGSIRFSDGCVIVIGNEANGITDETKKICKYRITIPMSGNAESLNASVAASIVAWEMMKKC